jgi:hypothetical protein
MTSSDLVQIHEPQYYYAIYITHLSLAQQVTRQDY